MDSDELRQMSITNAKLALNQAKWNASLAMNQPKLERIEPFPITTSQRELLRKMRLWFERAGMRKFKVILVNELEYTGISWSHYISNYVDREGYGEVAREVLNKLRLIYIQESRG